MKGEINTDIKLEKNIKSKNETLRELSTCAIKKFNDYEILKKDLERNEHVPYTPIDVVYEPTFHLDKPVYCYFCPQIHLAYRAGTEKFRRGSKYIDHTTARQCHYCNHYFVKSEEKMNYHMSVCAAKAGVTYSFDNAKIIDYQDNYKFMGDVPFTVYFDFETTTGSVGFFDAKMYVVSYCMIVAFHRQLNFPKIAIYRGFYQNREEIYNMRHFKNEHRPFFDKITYKQLMDAAEGVLCREKTTSLAAMFIIELKFTVDTLKLWFDKTIKQMFVELQHGKKLILENGTQLLMKLYVEFAIFCLTHTLKGGGLITSFSQNTYF